MLRQDAKNTAAVASLGSAIACPGLDDRTLIFQFQVFPADSGINMIPRQHFAVRPLPVRIPLRTDACLLESPPPCLPVVALVPRVEPGAILPGRQNGASDPAVTACEHGFQKGLLRLVPREFHARRPRAVAKNTDLVPEFLRSCLPAPLERRVRLGHER